MSAKPEKSAASDGIVNGDFEVPCIVHSIIRGGIGFGIVGLAAFSVWAWGGKWFQNHLGEAGLYGACALVFIAFSGLLLYPLLGRSGSLVRFYTIFIPAFLAYATIWCIAWFVFRFGPGEWLGSLFGAGAFVGVLSWRLHNFLGFIQTSVVLFGLNAGGYFLGGQLMHWILNSGGSVIFNGLSKPDLLVLAKLAWGLAYGVGFGAGIGYVFHAVQRKKGSSAP